MWLCLECYYWMYTARFVWAIILGDILRPVVSCCSSDLASYYWLVAPGYDSPLEAWRCYLSPCDRVS